MSFMSSSIWKEIKTLPPSLLYVPPIFLFLPIHHVLLPLLPAPSRLCDCILARWEVLQSLTMCSGVLCISYAHMTFRHSGSPSSYLLPFFLFTSSLFCCCSCSICTIYELLPPPPLSERTFNPFKMQLSLCWTQRLFILFLNQILTTMIHVVLQRLICLIYICLLSIQLQPAAS